MSLLWLAHPAQATNYDVASDSQLRNAISNAGNGDTITFTANITLGSNLPTVQKNVSFIGGNFTLSGNSQYRGLFVESGTIAINDLTITNAVAQGGDGGNGWGGGAGGAGAGLGGALFVATGAHVAVNNVNLQNSSASGGNGGTTVLNGQAFTSGGGGGYWPTGPNGGNASFLVSGGGGTGGGGNGWNAADGDNGRFGGGGGGSGQFIGGSGGFGGGGSGSSIYHPAAIPGGFLGGDGGISGYVGENGSSGGGGGGAGLGGATFVQEGGVLTLAGSLSISGNTVAGGLGGIGGVLHTNGAHGAGVGSGLFLHGNGGIITLLPGAGQTQMISDAIVDQTGAGGTGANHGSWTLLKDGAGTTILTGANAYTGGTTVSSGVLQGNSTSLRGNIFNVASVVFDQSGNGTYAGNMSGIGTLTKTGAGTLTLTGTNTYFGGTTVSSGILQGNTSSLQGDILNNASVVFNQADNGAYAGNMSGTGRLTKTGTGTLALTGTNAYTGGTTVSDGLLLFNTDANLGAAGKSITLNGGSIGVTGTFAATSMSRPTTLAGDGGISVGQGALTWAGTIDGTGQLIKTGAGALELAGNNSYSGGTLVTGGVLRVTSDANLGAAGSGITLNGGFVGTTRDAAANLSITRSLTLLGANSGINVDLNPLTWSGTISGDGQLTKTGAGTLTLGGTNTYSGGTAVNGGTLLFTSDANLGAAGTGISLNDSVIGVVSGNGGQTINRSLTIANLSAIDISVANPVTWSGVISGPGTLVVGGGGTLILSGANTYTGGTTVSSGVLQGNASSLQGNILNIASVVFDQAGSGTYAGNMSGTGSLTKTGTGTLMLTGTNTYAGGTSVSSGVLQGNASSLQGNILNDASVVFDQAGGGTYAGNMSGTGSLTKIGTGSFTLTGTNTHAGGTTVSAGLLLFNADLSLGAAGTAITLNGGLIGPTATAAVTSMSRPIALAGEGGISVTQGALTWAGTIGGIGQFIKTGAGALELAGNNTYSGGTLVTGGVLRVTSDANLGATGTGITLNGGFVGTSKDAAAGLAIGRSLTLAGANSTSGINVDLNPLTWSGTISGDGQLTKTGDGTLTLGGTNTYSGGTAVNGGILLFTSDANLGAAGKGISLNNGTIGVAAGNGGQTINRPLAIPTLGAVYVPDNVTSPVTWSGTISGPGMLVVDGGGTLILSGTNTYAGGTKVTNGTLLFGADANLGAAGKGISLVSGTIGVASGNGGQTIDRPITITTLGAIHVSQDVANPVTWRGDISGDGRLIKTGAGVLQLTGSSTYTGGTTVSAGTLQGTSRSLQGAITNNASVIFDQTFDGTYAGDMSGAGTLTKNGSGTLHLTGTSSVGGGTTINAGGLAVNGHLASNVTLFKGSSLSGIGDITGHITNNGGTIKPGNSIGQLKVNGNFTFNGGTYEVEVNAKGESDRVNVVGAGHKVMINAGTLQIVPEAGTYTPNTTYTIITTEGGGTVTFDSVTGGVGFLRPKVSLDREHVYVTLALAPNAFRSAGQTVNQQAVGGALDASAAAGNVGGLLTAMANLPTSQGAAALQAMSGQPWADFGTVNLQASLLFMNAVGRQMAVDRGSALGGTRSVALARACDVACDAGTVPRFSAWLNGIGSTGSVSGDSNAAGLTYTLGGAAFGIDYRLDPRFLLGIAGGYVGGTQWVNGFTGNGYTDALSVAFYGSFTPNGPGGGGFYADALAGYANASNRMQRIVSIPGLQTGFANGSTNANQFLGQVETGYKVALGFPGNTTISPFGRLQIGSSNQAAFSESGSSFFNLSVASQTTTSVRTTFGADFGARFDLGSGTPLDIGLRLGWMHEFADTARPMTAAFAAAPGPQFTVWGATPQRDSAVIGFSAATALNERTSLFVSYDGEVGGGTKNHQLRAGFRLVW